MRTVGKTLQVKLFLKTWKAHQLSDFPFQGKCTQLFRSFHISQIICSFMFLESIHSEVFNVDGFTFNEVMQFNTFNHYRLEFIASTSIKRWILESKLWNSIKPTNLAVVGEKLFVNILSLCVFYFSFSHHFSVNIKIHEFISQQHLWYV